MEQSVLSLAISGYVKSIAMNWLLSQFFLPGISAVIWGEMMMMRANTYGV